MKYGGMDTSFYFDKDGRGWVVYCTRPFDKDAPADMSAIHMNEFDWRADSIKTQTWELTTGSGCMESARWIEGPHLYRVGKYYYLMCAEGGTERMHSEVIFRSRQLTGPWESFSGNPILTQRDLSDTSRAEPVSCTGHADLVQDADGGWWAVFLGCRPYGYDLYNTGRETFLLPVTWQDGWPLILAKGTSVPTVVAKPGLSPNESNLNTGNFEYEEKFDSESLGPQWIYLRNPEMRNYKVMPEGRPGLEITPTGETLSGKGSPSCAFYRQKNTCFTASTQVSFHPEGSAIAGLAVFQSDKNHLVFGKTLIGGRPAVELKMTVSGQSWVIGSEFIPDEYADSPVMLRVDGDGQYYSFSFRLGNSEEGDWKTLAQGVDCVFLSKTFSGGFVGTTIGLYASLNR